MQIRKKGKMIIFQRIWEKLGISPSAEIDFVKGEEEKNRFNKFRGIATIKMSTDEIISLTRGK